MCLRFIVRFVLGVSVGLDAGQLDALLDACDMVTYPPALDLLFLDVPSKFESVALHNGVMYDRLGLTQVMTINDDADAVAEGLVEVEDQRVLIHVVAKVRMPIELPAVFDALRR